MMGQSEADTYFVVITIAREFQWRARHCHVHDCVRGWHDVDPADIRKDLFRLTSSQWTTYVMSWTALWGVFSVSINPL